MIDLAILTASAATTVPAASAIRNHTTRSIANSTNNPPWGAVSVTPVAMTMPPVTAPPSIIDGITRNGSAAANGMAPSEMNDAPSSHAALPFSRSAVM